MYIDREWRYMYIENGGVYVHREVSIMEVYMYIENGGMNGGICI